MGSAIDQSGNPHSNTTTVASHRCAKDFGATLAHSLGVAMKMGRGIATRKAGRKGEASVRWVRPALVRIGGHGGNKRRKPGRGAALEFAHAKLSIRSTIGAATGGSRNQPTIHFCRASSVKDHSGYSPSKRQSGSDPRASNQNSQKCQSGSDRHYPSH
jgi:hypothetical protein